MMSFGCSRASGLSSGEFMTRSTPTREALFLLPLLRRMSARPGGNQGRHAGLRGGLEDPRTTPARAQKSFCFSYFSALATSARRLRTWRTPEALLGFLPPEAGGGCHVGT